MAGTSLIELPHEGRMSPEMRALPTDRQRRFVLAMLDLGTNNHSRCARVAGYEGDNEVIKTTAYRLAHDEAIQAAIQVEAKRRLNSAAILAVSTVVQLAESSADDKIKLKAAEMIMNRAGLHATTESKVIHAHTIDDKGEIEKILRFCKVLGVDPRKMLGSAGVVLDGEFRVVEEEDDLSDVLGEKT